MNTTEIRNIRTSYETSLHYETVKKLCDELEGHMDVVRRVREWRDNCDGMYANQIDWCLAPLNDKEG